MTTDPFQLICDRLQQHGKTVKWNNNRAQAQCPAHPDNQPSLTITRGTTQPVTMHCHAGCATIDILTALDLTWADISNPRNTPTPTPPATYLYTDTDGTPVYRVIRGDNKQFRQQHLTADGEWRNGRAGIQPILYNLPAVTEAITNHDPIYIVEGEKDADTLTRHGHTATTNPGGAGNFTAEMADTLQHATQVVIIADDDTPGHQHAHHISQLLTQRNIPHTLNLPAVGKDISEQEGQGFDPTRTRPLTTTTNTPALDELAHLIDWPGFWQQTHDDEQWIAYPLIPKSRTVSLFAPAKAGKSTILLAVIAAACTQQQPLNNAHTAQQPVSILYLDYEMSHADLYERLTMLGYGQHTDLSRLHYALLPSLPPLDTPEGGQHLLTLAQQLNVDAVVVDTIGRAVEGEENSADTIRAFYRNTAQQLKAAGIAVLRTDHSGKDAEKGQRGSSAKNDDVDIVYRLTRTSTGVNLTRTHSRITWAPDTLNIDYTETDDGTVTVQLATTPTFPDGTAPIAHQLDELQVPIDATQRAAGDTLRAAGHKCSSKLLRAALQMRRERHLRNDPFGITQPVDNPVDNSDLAPRRKKGDNPKNDSAQDSAQETKPNEINAAQGSAQVGARIRADSAQGAPVEYGALRQAPQNDNPPQPENIQDDLF